MNTKLLFGTLILTVTLLSPATLVGGGLPAFPGAEGFGAVATGGRGGNVYKVTNLDGAGVGSLQWALNRPGPRIIVFAVSGVIVADVNIPHGDFTLAGQTAPGAGITINGHLYSDYDPGNPASNMIIRHLRVRPPDPNAQWPDDQHDAIQLSVDSEIILDHVDASHAADEIIDMWGGATNITVQWSAITFPIYDPSQGWNHHKGLINHRPCLDPGNTCDANSLPGGKISVHHNLFVHARNRTPALSVGPAEIINNVIYNGLEGFVHHNWVGATAGDADGIGEYNFFGNTYKDGPSANLAPFWFDPENSSPPIPSRYYMEGNQIDDPGNFVGPVDNPFTTPGFASEYSFYCCGIDATQFDYSTPFDFSIYSGHQVVSTQPADSAMTSVLANVGAFPRDIVNQWAVDQTENRTGSWGNIRPADWLQGLTPGTPPPDLDNDGMADAWELTHGLNPNDGSDHSTVRPSGYTAIEEYINGLADGFLTLFADGFENGDTSGWSS